MSSWDVCTLQHMEGKNVFAESVRRRGYQKIQKKVYELEGTLKNSPHIFHHPTPRIALFVGWLVRNKISAAL